MSDVFRGTADSAKTMIGWVLQTFRTREARPMMTPFTAFVLSRLEYHIKPEIVSS